MNSYTIKTLAFFLSLFVIITISSQIYLAFQDDYKTETAISYSAAEKIDFKGIYVRNEAVINYSGAGVINYPYADGSKVAKGSIVANVYNNEADITLNQNIIKLNKELEMLKKDQNPGTTKVAQPEFLSKLIEEKYQDITSSIEKKDLYNLSTQRDDFLSLMNIKQISINSDINYNERISYLESEISSLTAQKISPIQSIAITTPGYFVSYTDGYEDKLNCDNVNTLTAEQIKQIVKDNNATSSQTSSIGKIVDGYTWKMVGIIDNSRNHFLQGAKVQLNISSSTDPVNVTIDEIKKTSNPNESIVILSCDKLTFNLVQHRVERVELLLNNYEGIKVPEKAIRFYNGEKGVYVKFGQQLAFKKIDVIFEGDDYILSNSSPKNGYLLLYDDIVVDGVNTNKDVVVSEISTETANEGSDVTESTAQSTESSETTTSSSIVVGITQSTQTTTATKAVTTTD